MKSVFTISSNLIAIVVFLFSSFAPVTESRGQENSPEGEVTMTHSMDPNTVFLSGALSCRTTADSFTTENHYWRSFVLTDFGIASDFNVTMVDIGIQEAVGGNGGVQPLTCNLYVTDGSPFPNDWPSSLILIGTTTLNVPDQAGTHFPIAVTGTAPAGSELVVEISIPVGAFSGNKFFIGINDFGQTAPSYILAPGCGFSVPTVITVPPGFTDQHYVMSVTGDTTSAVGIEDGVNTLITFSLDQNYPNPFNPTTQIKYSIPIAEVISIKVFDIRGKEVATLVDEFKNAGEYVVEFDGSRLSNGVYFYQIRAGSFTQTKRMILMK
jgi:Secretion system C-terminal sorting domain